MTRYTISAHYLVSRLIIFVRDAFPMTPAETWMWVMLKPSTPAEICDVLDPAVLLQWSEHAGHAESKTDCYQQVVKWL